VIPGSGVDEDGPGAELNGDGLVPVTLFLDCAALGRTHVIALAVQRSQHSSPPVHRSWRKTLVTLILSLILLAYSFRPNVMGKLPVPRVKIEQGNAGPGQPRQDNPIGQTGI
jgi:hypothetical protein